jgi:hypothetical protein
LAVAVGVAAPPALCAVLIPFRHDLANTDAALVLVALIVAVAALGNRLGGVLAALSAGVWFDFFLTRPYEHFSINTRDDAETTVLLLAVGVAVTELAMWGRRQHTRSANQAGYLAGIHAASEVVALGGSPTKLSPECSTSKTAGSASAPSATLPGSNTTAAWSGVTLFGTWNTKACRLARRPNCWSPVAGATGAGS